jgi:hypothetical protein
MRPSATVALRRGGRHRERDAALLQGSASCRQKEYVAYTQKWIEGLMAAMNRYGL